MALADLLADALPACEQFSILSLQSPPIECSPVVGDNTQRSDLKTICSQHFYALAHNKKVFYALEIMVYFSIDSASCNSERTIFISKADTNGYCDTRVSISRVTRCLLEYTLSIDPNHYLKRVIRKHKHLSHYSNIITSSTSTQQALRILAARYKAGEQHKRFVRDEDIYTTFDCPSPIQTKISLFTRAEPQYLFAESSANPKKHILSGEALLKWWLAIIDSVVQQYFATDTIARLQIPGEDASVIRNYLRRTSYAGWAVGDIFSGTASDLAAHNIPRYADDPKSRFLDELDEEGRLQTTTVASFWEELQARQEFRLGAVVSVIGVHGPYTGALTDPPRDDLLVPDTIKKYKAIKHYITAEDFETVNGALDAYTNLKDFLALRYNLQFLSVTGTRSSRPEAANGPTQDTHIKRTAVNNLNNLIVRKKAKNRS